jgi:hypothetical protein
MVDNKRGYGNTAEAERFVRMDNPFIKRKKTEYPRAIIHDRGDGKYRRDMLDAIKLPKSHEVIVMPVGPDHRINMWGTVPEQLLAEVRRGVYQQVKAIVFNQK